MPKMDGLTAVIFIWRDSPESEILIVTHFESLDLARYAAQAGVRGYISKSHDRATWKLRLRRRRGISRLESAMSGE